MAAKQDSTGTTRTEVRHLFATTPARKGWERTEAYLLNCWRKLTEEQRLAVTIYAERLALARITARLERKRRPARKPRHG